MLTTDPNDPRLTRPSTEPGPQREVYLVLSEEERGKGFVRPYRDRYVHTGAPGPKGLLQELTAEEQERYNSEPDPAGYVKFEVYPQSEAPKTGRFWTQAELDAMAPGCGTETVMGRAIAETYARSPGFYGATYCVGCSKHLPVAEFRWADGSVVGS